MHRAPDKNHQTTSINAYNLSTFLYRAGGTGSCMRDSFVSTRYCNSFYTASEHRGGTWDCSISGEGSTCSGESIFYIFCIPNIPPYILQKRIKSSCNRLSPAVCEILSCQRSSHSSRLQDSSSSQKGREQAAKEST